MGSGAEEFDRLIADDQNQIDEDRMISTRALQLQTIEVNRLRALGKLQQSPKKRKESECKRGIERDRLKKSNQRVVMYTPDQKRKKMNEEVNVFAQSGLGRRQRENGLKMDKTDSHN